MFVTLQKIKVEFKNNLKSVFIRPQENFSQLDGLRAISIMMVIVFHCYFSLFSLLKKEKDQLINFIDEMPGIFNWVWQGDKGVDIFFILSGFLIANKLFKELDDQKTIKIQRFYRERLLRIMPAYMLVILLTAATTNRDLVYLLANVLFINNFLPLDKMFLRYTWTITVEMQFYFIMPFFIMLVFRRVRYKVWLLISMFFGASLIRLIILLSEPMLFNTKFIEITLNGSKLFDRFAEALYGNFYTRFGPFILGILVAYLYKYHRQKLTSLIRTYPGSYNFFVLISILLTIVSISIPYHNKLSVYNTYFSETGNLLLIALNRNVFSFGVVALLLVSLFPTGNAKYIKTFFSAWIFYPIARVSYSMYLCQFPFIMLAVVIVQGDFDQGQFVATLSFGKMALISILSILLTFLFSILTFAIIEAPFINIYKKPEPNCSV
jgi:peptidoglycan/LPS O-acetylase OafA/YrhL